MVTQQLKQWDKILEVNNDLSVVMTIVGAENKFLKQSHVAGGGYWLAEFVSDLYIELGGTYTDSATNRAAVSLGGEIDQIAQLLSKGD